MNHVVCYFTAVFLIIGGFEYGHCEIKCYSCSSKENSNCLNPEKNGLEVRKCDSQALLDMKKYAESVDHKFGTIYDVSLHTNNMPLIPMNCMKQVTVVGKEEYIIRGCQFSTEQRLDFCTNVDETSKRERINVTHCSMCATEGCNSVSQLQSFTFTTVLIPVAMHLIKFIVRC